MTTVVPEAVLDGLFQELRRGTVVLACLVRLRDPDYGYALLETFKSLGILVDGNTLYPLLRRLEKQGLLTSYWNTDDVRPRKFYRTTPVGDEAATALSAEWEGLDAVIRRVNAFDSSGTERGDE